MGLFNEIIPMVVAVLIPTVGWAITLTSATRAAENRLTQVERRLKVMCELIEQREARVRAGDARTPGQRDVIE